MKWNSKSTITLFYLILERFLSCIYDTTTSHCLTTDTVFYLAASSLCYPFKFLIFVVFCFYCPLNSSSQLFTISQSYFFISIIRWSLFSVASCPLNLVILVISIIFTSLSVLTCFCDSFIVSVSFLLCFSGFFSLW